MKIKVIAESLIAQLIVFWSAFALYRVVFSAQNFSFINNRGNHADDDLLTTLYFTAMTHTRIGAPDVMATSPLSRFFVIVHALISHALGSAAIVNVVASSANSSNFA